MTSAPESPWTAADHGYMARALRLARRGRYSTHPNPRVGCVLVRDGRIVGEGWHRRAGEPHAEIEALAAAGESARGATCYVSLEPCSHHGRTPPCVEALMAAGVARVVAAMGDPNPRVDGSGAQRLREGGIPVSLGLLGGEAEDLNRGFIQRMRRGRPWVRVKLAMSLDGRTAMASGESQWITGAEARADVQRLRAEAGAVLTGVGTVLADDPSLNIRDPALDMAGRLPLRVVLDSSLRMPPAARLLHCPGPVLVIAAESPAGERRRALEAAGAEVVLCPGQGGRVDLDAAMAVLAGREINEVLVEAGATLAGALLRAALMDELVLYAAPRLLGDRARGLVSLPGLEHLANAPMLRITDVRTVGADLRLIARVASAP